MKHPFFMRVLLLSAASVFLLGSLSLISMDGGLADPVPTENIWDIASRTFKKARANQSKLDIIESIIPTESTIDGICSKLNVNKSKLDVIESIIPTESTIDGIYSKLNVNKSKLDVIESIIPTESTIDGIYSKLDVNQSKLDVIEGIIPTESTIDGISSKIDVLDSKIDLLDVDCSCAATPITSSITIIASGSYCLSQDITGVITIDADNVTVDLNRYAVVDGSNGIVLNNNHSDILIMNGTVGGGSSATQVGISVGSGCARIALRNLNVIDCELVAVDLGGINSAPIKSIDVDRCFIESSGMGLQMDNVQGGRVRQCSMSFNITGFSVDDTKKLVVEDCCSFANERAGFELQTSSNNHFENCKAIKNGETGSDNAFGFIATSGSCNTFIGCIAEDTSTNSVSASKMAAGFAFTGTEKRSVFVDCISKRTQAVATGGGSQAKSFGVYLEAGTTQKCIVRDNLISGTTGDAGGVGCEADGSAHLIIRNIGYENDTNFGTSITNVHTGGLGVDSKALDNLSFPPL